MDEASFGGHPYSWTSIEELEQKFRAKLDELIGDDIIRIGLEADEDGIAVVGEVYSDEARSQALRLITAFLTNQRFVDRIEVTGVFQPATNDDWFLQRDTVGSSPTSGKGHEESPVTGAGAVQRYPHVVCHDQLLPGTWITIAVDLPNQPPTTGSEPITLATLEPGWETIFVDVTITSSAISSLDGGGRVVVREDGSSKAAHFAGKLREDLSPDAVVEITAIFTHNGRYCGCLTEQLGNVVRVGATPSPLRVSQMVTITPQAPSPSMTVTITSYDARRLQWNWVLGPGIASNTGPLSGMSQLSSDPADFSANLMVTCPEMLPSDLQRQMGSIGETIWEATPQAFRDIYAHLQQNHGSNFPIQFILDAFHIPWEMMKPPGGDHLYLTHPIARWSMRRGDHPARLPNGAKITFVPEYESNGTLPAARQERDWLVEHLGASIAMPKKAVFLELMAAKDPTKTSLVHFAGHGFAASSLTDAALRMEDGTVGLRDVDVSYTQLGERDRCLVVLNACESATVRNSLSWVDGWAPSMISRGFGALVAPLWRVQDAAACDVVTTGLRSLYEGKESIGAAFTAARSGVAAKSSAAFAFLTYGDVMATISDQI